MRTSKRQYVMDAVESMPIGEFMTRDVRDACSRDLAIREISGNLRSLENVRMVKRGSSGSGQTVWEKLYRI